MKYKGYTGMVELDEESGSLFGRVIGLRDVITFQGESVTEVVQAFHDSVDDYLEFCTERGESLEKPYSGQFVLRIDPQLHREMAIAAEERNLSLNALVEDVLRRAFTVPEDALEGVLPSHEAKDVAHGRQAHLPAHPAKGKSKATKSQHRRRG
jgi:predicted HicB family RNase H-like nuclease